MAGDFTNLVGCILTDQLTFQKVTAAWFCCVDVVLLVQFAIYSKREREKAEAAERAVAHVDLDTHRSGANSSGDARHAALISSSHRRAESYSKALASAHRARLLKSLSTSTDSLTGGSKVRGANEAQLDMSASADLGTIARKDHHEERDRGDAFAGRSRSLQQEPRRGRADNGSQSRRGLLETTYEDANAASNRNTPGFVSDAPYSDPPSRASSVHRGRRSTRASPLPGGSVFSRASSFDNVSRARATLEGEVLRVAAQLATRLDRSKSSRRVRREADGYFSSRYSHKDLPRYTASSKSSRDVSRSTSRAGSAATSPQFESRTTFSRSRSHSGSGTSQEPLHEARWARTHAGLSHPQPLPRIDSIASTGSESRHSRYGTINDSQLGSAVTVLAPEQVEEGLTSSQRGSAGTDAAQPRVRSRPYSRLAAGILGLFGVGTLLGGSDSAIDLLRLDSSSSLRSTTDTPSFPSSHQNPQSLALRPTLAVRPYYDVAFIDPNWDEVPDDDNHPQPEVPLDLLIGRASSWLCTLLYLTSRLPQIYTNHLRRSVEGLSILLFISAFLGNLLYSISIVTNPLASDGGDYWRESMPFLLGSAGTLVFDAIVVAQWWVWGGAQNDGQRKGKKRRKRRKGKGTHRDYGTLVPHTVGPAMMERGESQSMTASSTTTRE
ncbi:unnamed protein product [Jaminaea pallidilutea]